jgi:3-dehydroquinate dehydratase-1
MRFDEFVLVGVTDDLLEEPKVREIADAIGFEVDTAKKPIKQLSEYSGELPLIVTNRSKPEAGDQDRLNDLFRSTRIRQVEAIDIGLETIRENDDISSELEKFNIKTIVSYYNFDGTPNENQLNQIVDEAANYGDVVRVVTFAESHEDILINLSCINKYSENGTKIAGTSLGEIGKHSRAISPQYGSKIGYAPITKSSSDINLVEIELKELHELINNINYEENPTQMPDSLEQRLEQMGWTDDQLS